MDLRRLWWRSIVPLAVCLPMSLAAAAPPPATAFGRIPAVRYVSISPDGRRLAWEQTDGVPTIIVHDLGAGITQRRVEVGDQYKPRGLAWADDQTLLLTLSRPQRYFFRGPTYEISRMLAIDVGSGQVQVLLMDQPDFKWVTGARLLATHTPKPGTVVMSTYDWATSRSRETIGTRIWSSRKDSGWAYNVFDVDTRTGNGEVIGVGNGFTIGWVLDPDSRPVARVDWQADARKLLVYTRRDGSWREIFADSGASELGIQGTSPDGRSLIVLGNADGGRTKAWTLPLDGGSLQPMFEDPVDDVENVVLDPVTLRPVAMQLGGLEQRVHWIDDRAVARQRKLERAFPGLRVTELGRSTDGKRAVVVAGGPRAPGVYYLVDFATGHADIVGEEYPALAGATLGEVRTLTYKARDGIDIPAYLTLPPGRDAKGLPLVALPHGGPDARDDYDFDWLAQFLATRGYAVLQPQFRGSTGFGRAHLDAGIRQWGARMQEDVTDGVQALVAQGLADPKRICIVGASYGGYAALAGVAFTPDLYACAASINGVTDLVAWHGHLVKKGGDEANSLVHFHDYVGDVHDPQLAARSPTRAAAAIRAPVLLIQGSDDTVVPPSQAEAMDRALRAVKRPPRLVMLPGEDHWLSGSDTRVRVLQELERFLAEHLQPGN